MYERLQSQRRTHGFRLGDIVMSEEPDTYGMIGEVIEAPSAHPSEFICGGNYYVLGLGIILGDYMKLVTPVEWRADR